MADDVTLPGIGQRVATDDDGTRQWQWVKLSWGPDGTFNKADTASGKPLPVQIRSSTGGIPLGSPTDAKNPATDTTSASVVEILKQLSWSLQFRGMAASGVTPVTGTFTATGQSSSFVPLAGRGFNVTIRNTFVATVQLERTFDAGSNWVPISVARTAPDSSIYEEPEFGISYRLNCTAFTSGTVTYRISQ